MAAALLGVTCLQHFAMRPVNTVVCPINEEVSHWQLAARISSALTSCSQARSRDQTRAVISFVTLRVDDRELFSAMVLHRDDGLDYSD